jgi:NAD-dependent SIR2 family protein deacetylase
VLKATIRGAKLLIINAEPTQYDEDADVVIRGDIPSVLGEILGMPTAN